LVASGGHSLMANHATAIYIQFEGAVMPYTVYPDFSSTTDNHSWSSSFFCALAGEIHANDDLVPPTLRCSPKLRNTPLKLIHCSKGAKTGKLSCGFPACPVAFGTPCGRLESLSPWHHSLVTSHGPLSLLARVEIQLQNLNRGQYSCI
jgi:hypothetical protein